MAEASSGCGGLEENSHRVQLPHSMNTYRSFRTSVHAQDPLNLDSELLCGAGWLGRSEPSWLVTPFAPDEVSRFVTCRTPNSYFLLVSVSLRSQKVTRSRRHAVGIWYFAVLFALGAETM